MRDAKEIQWENNLFHGTGITDLNIQKNKVGFLPHSCMHARTSTQTQKKKKKKQVKITYVPKPWGQNYQFLKIKYRF